MPCGILRFAQDDSKKCKVSYTLSVPRASGLRMTAKSVFLHFERAPRVGAQDDSDGCHLDGGALDDDPVPGRGVGFELRALSRTQLDRAHVGFQNKAVPRWGPKVPSHPNGEPSESCLFRNRTPCAV